MLVVEKLYSSDSCEIFFQFQFLRAFFIGQNHRNASKWKATLECYYFFCNIIFVAFPVHFPVLKGNFVMQMYTFAPETCSEKMLNATNGFGNVNVNYELHKQNSTCPTVHYSLLGYSMVRLVHMCTKNIIVSFRLFFFSFLFGNWKCTCFSGPCMRIENVREWQRITVRCQLQQYYETFT